MATAQFLAGILFAVVASLVVPVALLLILPGRKGKMLTRLEVLHDRSRAADICELYARRLEHDGFVVDRGAAPHFLSARRRQDLEKMLLSGEPITHASKDTSVRVTIAPDGQGNAVAVTAEGWLNDFVVFDTGEGRQLDLLLHRLTEADLARDPPPVTPLPSFHAFVAVSAAALVCAAPFLAKFAPSLRQAPANRPAVMLGIAAGGVLITLSEARATLRDIRAKPGEITGSLPAWCAVVGAAVGAIGCAAALLLK